MAQHARLSASASDRWINCPSSVMLIEKHTVEGEVSSEYADEGTCAHELADLRLRRITGQIKFIEFEKKLEELKNGKYGKYYSEEMEEYVKDYTSYIAGLYAEALQISMPLILSERTVDLSSYIEGVLEPLTAR